MFAFSEKLPARSFSQKLSHMKKNGLCIEEQVKGPQAEYCYQGQNSEMRCMFCEQC